MNAIIKTTTLTVALLLLVASASAQNMQSNPGAELTELNGLKDRIKDPDTRTRVWAFQQVWTIALLSERTNVKLLALDLMKEPVASASDHIRTPAVYSIAEIANSTGDKTVKAKALAALKEPLVAGQLPVRIATLDAINSILRSANSGDLALQALELVGEPMRSGNNGIRMPAINSATHIALASHDDRAFSTALELMQAPLNSMAMIGGMEVRMMAVAEVEKLGIAAPEPATKGKALQILQACAGNNLWEPEARRRATTAAAWVRSTMNESSPSSTTASAKLSVSSTPDGADIEVDGNFLGSTPSELSISEGEHTIQIKKAGFKPWERKLQASAGSAVRISAELEKAE